MHPARKGIPRKPRIVGVGNHQRHLCLLRLDQGVDVAGAGQMDVADVVFPFRKDLPQRFFVRHRMLHPGRDHPDLPAVLPDLFPEKRLRIVGKEGEFVLFRVKGL